MCLRFYLSLALSLASTGGASIVINPTFTDAQGVSWTPAMQNTVHQAISDWTSLLDHPSAQPISVDFTFMDSGFGLFTGSGSFAVGTDLYPWTPGMNHTISLNADFIKDSPSNPFYFDQDSSTVADLDFSNYDALSVFRHEIGHMLGITALYVDDFSTGSAVNRWTSQITDVDLSMSFNEGDIFDQGGLNITMADGAHFSDSGSTLDDLMNTSISNGERREISQISLDALILAHGYVQIPEPRLYGLLAGALALGLTLRRRR